MKSLTEWMEQPNEFFRLVLDNLEDYAVFLLDPDGRIATWNRGAQRILGYSEDEIVGQFFSVIFTDKAVRQGGPCDEMNEALEDNSALDERWHVRADGSRFWASGHLTAIRDENDELIGYVKIVRDLTERHREEQLRNRQLREVATRLTRVEQHERQRIATDLHGTLAQELLASRLKLASVNPADEPSARRRDETLDLLDRSMRYVRDLIATLSPVALQSMTLGEALQGLAERMQRNRELAVHLDVDTRGIPLSEELRVLLFQAAHELLLNVAKHTDAHEANLALGRDAQWAYLRVSDRGAGFDASHMPSEPTDTGGFGLPDVRARVQALGGEFEVHSAPGEGTTITLRVPLIEAQSTSEAA
ncbi:MAG: PAS domain-containing sensor histidine kinase [Phycisphaeraceae bacterium]